jgi:hypothetical protein
VIAGTPTAAGSFSFLVQGKDKKGASTTSYLTVEVGTPLTITTPAFASPDAAAGRGIALTAAGGRVPYRWSVSAATPLPAGYALYGATLVTDFSLGLGEYPVDVTVTDDAGASATRRVTIGLYDPIVPSGPTAAGAAVNGPVSLTFSATGGRPGALRWSFDPAAPPPAGLSIDPVSGTVTGAVATAGSYTLGLVVADGTGLSGLWAFVLTVQ